MKLMLMDLINTLVRCEAISEQDMIEILKRVAVVSPDELYDDPLIGLQRALKIDDLFNRGCPRRFLESLGYAHGPEAQQALSSAAG